LAEIYFQKNKSEIMHLPPRFLLKFRVRTRMVNCKKCIFPTDIYSFTCLYKINA